MIKLKNLIKEATTPDTYYHVSPIEYNPGDIIKPYFDSNKYAKEIDASKSDIQVIKTVEKIISKAKPGNEPSRDKAIFVFRNIMDAKRYAKQMGGNRKIYTISTNDIINWHDMNWVDHLFGEVVSYNNQVPANRLKDLIRRAGYYWNGKSASQLTSAYLMTKPRWEGMTNNPVKVIDKIK